MTFLLSALYAEGQENSSVRAITISVSQKLLARGGAQSDQTADRVLLHLLIREIIMDAFLHFSKQKLIFPCINLLCFKNLCLIDN